MFAVMFNNVTGGCTDGRMEKLKTIYNRLSTNERMRLRIEECCDEKTGKRYGRAKCRVGRCEKIGGGGRNRGSRYAYQVWAVWA